MPELWKEKANLFATWCAEKLWSPEGRSLVEYLRHFGLEDQTLKDARIGWNPSLLTRSRVEWGLKPKLNQKQEPQKLYLPSGIVIPTFVENEVVRVRVWEYTKKEHPTTISGSTPALLIAGNIQKAKKIAVFESELQAILFHQIYGAHGVSAVGLGETETQPSGETLEAISKAESVVLAVGKQHSWARIAYVVQGAMRIDPPSTKKPDMREWGRAALPGLSPRGETASDKNNPDLASQARWNELAESGSTDLEADSLEEAIFLFAMEKIKTPSKETWGTYAGRWSKTLPEEAFSIVQNAYLDLSENSRLQAR